MIAMAWHTSAILIIAKRLGCLNLYFIVFTKLVFPSSTPVVRRDKSKFVIVFNCNFPNGSPYLKEHLKSSDSLKCRYWLAMVLVICAGYWLAVQ